MNETAFVVRKEASNGVYLPVGIGVGHPTIDDAIEEARQDFRNQTGNQPADSHQYPNESMPSERFLELFANDGFKIKYCLTEAEWAS